jgi:hypothetical protein
MSEYNGYNIVSDGTFGMFNIKALSGTIPEILRGAYTRKSFAMADIDKYVAFKAEIEGRPAPIKKVKLTPREVNDGSTDLGSGD